MPKESVYVYFRYNEKEKVMVVLNNNAKEQTLDLSRFAESLNGISAGQDVFTGKTFQLKPENKLTVSPKTSLILELN